MELGERRRVSCQYATHPDVDPDCVKGYIINVCADCHQSEEQDDDSSE